MPVMSWEAVLNAGPPYQTTNGTAYASSTTPTDVSPSPSITLPANYYYTGQLFRWTAWGTISTTGTPTILFGLYYGGVAGTALAATAATTTASGLATEMWKIDGISRVHTLGASGVITSYGNCVGIGATAALNVQMPATSAGGNAVTVNTTTANAWTIGATWGTNSASNTLTCFGFVLEQIS
jgi:hypothetical protein